MSTTHSNQASGMNLPGASVANELKKLQRIKMLATVTGLSMIEDDNDRMWDLNGRQHRDRRKIEGDLHGVNLSSESEGEKEMASRQISLGDVYNVTQVTGDTESDLEEERAKIKKESEARIAELEAEMQSAINKARQEKRETEESLGTVIESERKKRADQEERHAEELRSLDAKNKRRIDDVMEEFNDKLDALKKNSIGNDGQDLQAELVE